MTRGTVNIPVAGILFRRGNKILSLRRSGTGYEDGKYSLPAGHVEDWESFREAACREALEEVGLRVSPEHLTFKLVMHERHSHDVRVFVLFETTEWQGEPKNSEPEKHDEMTWLDLHNLPDNLMAFLPEALAAVNANQSYIEVGWEE